MRTVFKYKLDMKTLGEPFKLKLPMSAKILKFGVGNFKSGHAGAVIWAEVYTEHSNEDRELVIYGTGQEIASRDKHIGTCFEDASPFDPFVWHLYERF